LAQLLNEYLTPMTNLVFKYDGTLDKYMGDAIMAIWGAPLDDEQHPLHAVAAALNMQERVAELCEEWGPNGLPEIRTGIGINTGPMRVGNFGSEELFDYTVVGDQVNLASRIEGLNKVYGTSILISETTRNAVCDQVVCRQIDLVRVKGKDQQVVIYEPLRLGRDTDAELVEWEVILSCYRNREFGEADKRLQKLEAQSPSPLYRLYLERIRQFRQIPPPQDWDGCFIHLRK
jgi:adenylate cyclase